MVFIFSREGIVQGYPLATTGYGILVLPLIRKLKIEFTSVESPWYADDGSAVGSLENISSFFKRIEEIGPAYGYFPEEGKSILVVRGRDTEKANIFKEKNNFNFQIKNGYRYLGSHIGDLEEEKIWMEKNINKWSESVEAVAEIAEYVPQTAFAGIQRALQHNGLSYKE